MARKKHTFLLDAGIFPFDLYVFIGYSREEFIDTIKDTYEGRQIDVSPGDIPFTNTPGSGLYVMDNDSMSFILLPPYQNTPVWKSVAAHEISHFAIKIMEIIGQDINTETWETFCYLTQYVTEGLYSNIENGR